MWLIVKAIINYIAESRNFFATGPSVIRLRECHLPVCASQKQGGYSRLWLDQEIHPATGERLGAVSLPSLGADVGDAAAGADHFAAGEGFHGDAAAQIFDRDIDGLEAHLFVFLTQFGVERHDRGDFQQPCDRASVQIAGSAHCAVGKIHGEQRCAIEQAFDAHAHGACVGRQAGGKVGHALGSDSLDQPSAST